MTRSLVANFLTQPLDVEVGLDLGMELLRCRVMAVKANTLASAHTLSSAQTRPPALDRDVGDQQPRTVLVELGLGHTDDAAVRCT
jgi:hypothetical protein